MPTVVNLKQAEVSSLHGLFEIKSVLSYETERHNVEMEDCQREVHYFNELEIIPGKQVIAQRLRENANQHFRRKTICCEIKKISCYMKCAQGLSESAESLFSRINKTFARLSSMVKYLYLYYDTAYVTGQHQL